MKKPLLLVMLFLFCATCLSAYEFYGFGYEYLNVVPFGPAVAALFGPGMWQTSRSW